MALPPNPPFKLEISHSDKVIAFGPRFKGQIGRDILAVKIALGIVIPIDDSLESNTDNTSYDPGIPLDTQKWFNCDSGLGMDIRSASTFDTALQKALIKFQMDNQFLITSYLFQKFGVRDLIGESDQYMGPFPLEEYDRGIIRQISAALSLFESEYGRIGEATLAVLHGWRPHSTINNSSYLHDSRYSESNPVVDVFPMVLYSDLLDPMYPQNFTDMVNNGIAIQDSLVEGDVDKLARYVSSADGAHNWIEFTLPDMWRQDPEEAFNLGIRVDFKYASIDYYPVLSGTSPLYSAAVKVIELLKDESSSSLIMTSEDRKERSRMFFYPNPFTNPDPFIISGTKIGFYDNTEFSIDPAGTLPNNREETIARLEELALIKVLKHFKKPKIWNFLKDDSKFLAEYFSGTRTILPSHNGTYPGSLTVQQKAELVAQGYSRSLVESSEIKEKEFWVLSTSDITNLPETADSVQYWRTIESRGNTLPLIKFVEFVTPSLRPTDTYRALFEINRQKLDLIVAGDSLEPEIEEVVSTPDDQAPADICVDLNAEQKGRTFYEYKAHAMKRRREIVRKLRGAALEQGSIRQGTSVDLGSYGPFDLNSAFSSLSDLNSYTDYEFTQKILSMPTDVMASIGMSMSDLNHLQNEIEASEASVSGTDNNKLVMEFSELKERVEYAARDLREAQEIISREGISFAEGSQFDGANEAVLLESFVSNLEKETGGEDLVSIEFIATETSTPGPSSGKFIKSLKVGQGGGSDVTPELRLGLNSRPRTSNYIANIIPMTGGKSWMTKGFFMQSFFDDGRGSCKDLGIDIDKNLSIAFVGKYTSGLKVILDGESRGEAFQSWFKSEFGDPATSWWETSKSNLGDSWNSNFDEKAALRALGERCTFIGPGNIFEEFFDKVDLTSLLCDYLKCVKLPGFDIKTPSLSFPPPPKIKIVGWYKGLVEFILEQYADIGRRIACTFIKTIIDKLAFPFCEEQLEEFISAGSSASPVMNRALVESLINTGISSGNEGKAKDFFEKASSILTPQEICYLLEGRRLDDPTMLILQRLSSQADLDSDLDSYDSISNFFGTLGLYIPFDFCENLSQFDGLPKVSNCKDTQDLLRALRNRLQSGDSTLTDSEIESAVNLAQKNREDMRLSLQAFSENGFDNMMPDFFKAGDPNAVVSDYPEFLKKQFETTAQSLFGPAKSSYLQGLASYVPGMIIASPTSLNAYDEGYDDIEILRLEAALQQLQSLSDSFPKEEGDITPEPAAQWAIVHELYQVERVNGKLVHKRRFKLDPQVENLNASKISLTQEINYLTLRIGRTKGEKRDRLRRERRLKKSFRTAVDAKLARLRGENPSSEAGEDIISYNQYLEFQKTISNRLPGEEVPEFELLPWNVDPGLSRNSQDDTAAFALENLSALGEPYDPLSSAMEAGSAAAQQLNDPGIASTIVAGGKYSMDHEYFPFGTVIEPSYNELFGTVLHADFTKARILTKVQMIAYFNAIKGSDDFNLFNEAINKLQSRIESLNNRILEIVSRRPNILDSKLLPGLRTMLSRSTEKSLEGSFSSSRLETTETTEDTTSLQFNSGSLYSPMLEMKEYKAGFDKDRYDITIGGDFFLNLEPNQTKTFKFCEKLPSHLLDESYDEESFAKRDVFARMASDSLYRAARGRMAVTYGQIFTEEYYPKTTESLFEQVLDELSESKLFNSTYADDLDARVSGRRVINGSCVSNRYSFSDKSVLSFKELVLDDVAKEVMLELEKPENAPENADFDTPGAYELAMQTLGVKGFIRVCLVDLLLKGGLAYAVWDIEPIVTDQMFVSYAIEHVKVELSTSILLSKHWGPILERSTGISNKHQSLESFVKEELLKFPNFSKQIFHPLDDSTNFYNWYTDSSIKQFYIPRGPLEDQNSLTRFKVSRTIYGEEHAFMEEKPEFIIEHYITITGPMAIRAQEFDNIPEVSDANETLILSNYEFREVVERLGSSVSQELAQTSVISQTARVVLVEKFALGDYNGAQNGLMKFISRSLGDYLPELIRTQRSYLLEVSTRDISESEQNISSNQSNNLAAALPLFSHQKALDFSECYSFDTYFAEKEFQKAIPYIMQEFSKTLPYKMLFEHIFPSRRIMSLASIFSTGIVSGFNDLPSMFDSTKYSLASLVHTCATPASERVDLLPVTQEEFLKTITENFPSDPKDASCLDFPDISGEFFNKFLSDLGKLILKLPSIFFRGVANTLDPAYKEMRQHYLNCDIDNLTWRGVRPAGTVDDSLVNGLYLASEEDRRKEKGKYVPLVLGSISDFGYTAFSLGIKDFPKFGRRLEKTILKTISYIYSGNAPFLDPSMYFKVPCKDIEMEKWTKGGKYDFGKYGRYGHPISPFTALALSTPQLESDKSLKQNSCEEAVEVDCEDLQPSEILSREEQENIYQRRTEDEILAEQGRTRPSEEVIEGEREAIIDERRQAAEFIEQEAALTDDERQTRLENIIDEGEDTDPLTRETNPEECEIIRRTIRNNINRGYSTSYHKSRLAALGDCRGAGQVAKFSQGGSPMGYASATPSETKDYVTVTLVEGSREIASKKVEIEWRRFYNTGFPSEQEGYFLVRSREEYDNFR